MLTFLCHFSSGDPSTPFVASVKEEKDFWLNCLLEMKAGYEIADGKAREKFRLRYTGKGHHRTVLFEDHRVITMSLTRG